MRLLLLALLVIPSLAAARTPCGGEVFPILHSAGGAAPYVMLTAGGRTGNFLVDYGTTQSSGSRESFAGRGNFVDIDDWSLTGIRTAGLPLRDYGSHAGPPGGQMGILGTNHLSLLTATLDIGESELVLSPARCPETALRAAGLTPVGQQGFFSQDPRRVPSRPNVPVLWLEIGGVAFWAQIDSGYEDSLYPNSVDVNASLFRALQAAGVAMERAGGVTVGTCAGSEDRQVWRIAGGIWLTDGADNRIRPIGQVHIMEKQPNGCGGIAEMAEPAGQLGASFLRLLGVVVFDPKSERVWIPAAR